MQLSLAQPIYNEYDNFYEDVPDSDPGDNTQEDKPRSAPFFAYPSVIEAEDIILLIWNVILTICIAVIIRQLKAQKPPAPEAPGSNDDQKHSVVQSSVQTKQVTKHVENSMNSQCDSIIGSVFKMIPGLNTH